MTLRWLPLTGDPNTDGTNSFCLHKTYFGIACSTVHLWTKHPLTIIHCQFAAVIIWDSNALTVLFAISPYMQFYLFAGFANMSEHRSQESYGNIHHVHRCGLFSTLNSGLDKLEKITCSSVLLLQLFLLHQACSSISNTGKIFIVSFSLVGLCYFFDSLSHFINKVLKYKHQPST